MLSFVAYQFMQLSFTSIFIDKIIFNYLAKTNRIVVMENNPNQPIGKALSSFIISIIAVSFSSTMIFSIPGVVLGIISLALSNNSNNVTVRPYYTFRRIAKPMSIASIAVGATMSIIFIVLLFVFISRGGNK